MKRIIIITLYLNVKTVKTDFFNLMIRITQFRFISIYTYTHEDIVPEPYIQLTMKPGQVHCRIAKHNDRRFVAAGKQIQTTVEARAFGQKRYAGLLQVTRHRCRSAVGSCAQRERTTARRLVRYHNHRAAGS